MSSSQTGKSSSLPTGDLVTILSDRSAIPINCDECNQTTEISLELLKEQTIVCEHCSNVREFSNTEMQLMRSLLAQAGYRTSL